MSAQATAGVRVRPWLHLPTRVGWVVASATGFIALAAMVALLAPLIAPADPKALDLSIPFGTPSSEHLLGTDESGRDLLSRLIWGARTSLIGPLCVVVVATIVGSLIAVFAAFIGGWVDAVVNAVLNVMFAFPAILLAVLAVSIFGQGLGAAVIAVTIAYVPYVARVVRSEAIRQRSLPYVEASEIQGLSGIRIALRHLIPNVMPLIVAQATVSFGYAMIDLAAISYLGLGVQAPTPEWGSMVSSGQNGLLSGQYAESLLAGALIVLTVISFTVIGDRLADRSKDQL